MGNGGKWKAKSKRVSTKLRVKIEKKVNDHKKKLKKEMKKNPGKFRKSKKDPGVPSNCPFKEEVLAEAKAMVEKHAAEKEKRRLELKELRKQGKNRQLTQLRGQTLESLVAGAQQKSALFERGQTAQTAAVEKGLSDKSAKAYYREFKKVVEAADVVLEVLDARDPMGSRCREVEQAVLAGGGKRLVLVLNKADLIPRENLQAWIQYLRHELPTIAFKASTQQSGRLGHAKVNLKTQEVAPMTTSKCVGADTLLALLGNYCRNKDVKTSIRVGVVGMPNVGKSSLINSLKRSKACNVGATPGVTRAMQEVQLDSKIRLLDSPGLVLASGSRTDASVALKNAIKVENLSDPITPVVAILARVPREHLMLQYSLPHFKDCAEFLALLALQMGKLKKGAVPDRELAARIVLGDWNSGKIKYFTHPPETVAGDVSAEIVSEFAKEFSLDTLDQAEDMDTLPVVRPSEVVMVETGKMAETAVDEEEESMEEQEETGASEEDTENILPQGIEIQANQRGTAKKDKKEKEQVKDDPLFKLEGNLKLKKVAKIQQKKAKKEARRADKLATGLSDQMESAFSGLSSQDYSFDADFK